jgi:glycosyltransferase involved in cell wall biosynthesis
MDNHIRKHPRVLIVSPATTARGGIASVVRLHTKMNVWREMNCRLLPTFFDGGIAQKALAAAIAYIRAPFAIAGSDLVHIHVAGESSLLRKLPIVVLARLQQRPLIIHVHAHSMESLFERTPAWAVRYALGGAHRVVALSESWARAIKSCVPGANIEVIPNPVQPVAEACGTQDRKLAILFVGKLEPRKGYDLLLEAAPTILQRFPQVEFWFAGHGELCEAARKSEQLGITSSVRLLGWTNENALGKLYREARVFCLPSYNEGVPMSVLEAMANGVPVVCTPVGGIPQLIVDDRNGLLCSVGSPDSIAEKVIRLLNSPAFAESVAAEGLRTAKRSNGIEEVETKLRKLWQAIGSETCATDGKVVPAQ